MTSKGPPAKRLATPKNVNNTIEDDLNNSNVYIDHNDWFDDLDDNISKLPTNGMPHAAYEMIISFIKFCLCFSSDLFSALWLAAF